MRLLYQQKYSQVGWKRPRDKVVNAVRFPIFYRQKTGNGQQSCITLHKDLKGGELQRAESGVQGAEVWAMEVISMLIVEFA